jgi:hypothetical protein
VATPQQGKRRRAYGVLGLIVTAMMAFTAVAFADNLQADLNTTTGGLDKTVELGVLPASSAQSQNVFLFVQETPGGDNPTYPFNVTGSKGASSTFAGTASFSGVTISGPGTANGKTGQATWTTPAAQATTQSYSLVMTFDTNTTINESPATVTINFSVAGAPSDTTPPVITPTISGTLGNNGWYTSDVTVSWSVTDAQSAVSSSSGCGSTTISTDTAGTTLTCSATSAGGTSTDSVTIKRDATAPGVTWDGNISDNDSYYYGSVPAAPTCTASDALSGPKDCNVTGYGTTVGSHTLTATAEDNAGNQGSETRTYTVLAWTLKGFYQPTDMSGVVNTVKGGSTVPLKFEIFAGSAELTSTADVKSLVANKIACDAGANEDPVEVTATGGTSLRYDTTGGQFIYNWQTPKPTGICYRVTMTTQDGSSLAAVFKTR